ncbi:MAG TPA: hypothetical protein VHN15_12375 [Thermoanaerobaculia bacterium]|nr:hypothetical protein [Thermoanaerobaculia bacterium]
MKRNRKMESLDDQLFATLTPEEAQAVSGGDGGGHGEGCGCTLLEVKVLTDVLCLIFDIVVIDD